MFEYIRRKVRERRDARMTPPHPARIEKAIRRRHASDVEHLRAGMFTSVSSQMISSQMVSGRDHGGHGPGTSSKMLKEVREYGDIQVRYILVSRLQENDVMTAVVRIDQQFVGALILDFGEEAARATRATTATIPQGKPIDKSLSVLIETLYVIAAHERHCRDAEM